jgi:hypothetical protein
MAPLTSAALILGSLASLVAGHGYLKSVTVNGQNYMAWQVGQDDYVTPTPVRYARKLANNGPVPDFTTNNVTYVRTRNRYPMGRLLTVKLDAAQGATSPLGE